MYSYLLIKKIMHKKFSVSWFRTYVCRRKMRFECNASDRAAILTWLIRSNFFNSRLLLGSKAEVNVGSNIFLNKLAANASSQRRSKRRRRATVQARCIFTRSKLLRGGEVTFLCRQAH